jgi:hypothetical protein
MESGQFPSEAIIRSRLTQLFEAGKYSAAFDMNTGWKTSLHRLLRSTEKLATTSN